MPLTIQQAERILPRAINTVENCQLLHDAGTNAGTNAGYIAGILKYVYYAHNSLSVAEHLSTHINHSHLKHLYKIIRIIAKVNPPLISDENIQALFKTCDVYAIYKVINTLNLVNSTLITQKNIQTLVNIGSGIQEIVRVLELINLLFPALLTDNTVQTLINSDVINLFCLSKVFARMCDTSTLVDEPCALDLIHSQYILDIFAILNMMHAINSTLVTAKVYQILVNMGSFTWKAERALSTMARINPALITQETVAVVLHSNDSILDVTCALNTISPAHYALITPEHYQALIKAGSNAWNLAQTFDRLYSINPHLITPLSDEMIAAGADVIYTVCGLEEMHRLNPEFAIVEYGRALIRSASYAKEMTKIFITLHSIESSLITAEIVEALIAKREHSGEILKMLEVIHQTSPELLTQSNLNRLISTNAWTMGVNVVLNPSFYLDPPSIEQDSINTSVEANPNTTVSVLQGSLFQPADILIRRLRRVGLNTTEATHPVSETKLN